MEFERPELLLERFARLLISLRVSFNIPRCHTPNVHKLVEAERKALLKAKVDFELRGWHLDLNFHTEWDFFFGELYQRRAMVRVESLLVISWGLIIEIFVVQRDHILHIFLSRQRLERLLGDFA